MRTKLAGSFIVLTLCAASQLYSQASLPTSLPGLDLTGISGYYRMSRISGASGFRPAPTAPCAAGSTAFPMCGWGFELVYELTGKKQTPSSDEPVDTSWDTPAAVPKEPWADVEIGVGYDFLNIHAVTRAGNYELLGSIQTLPGIALYVSHDFPHRLGAYVGLGTGYVVLKNLRAYDRDGKIYAIAGDTWGFTPSLGAIYNIQEASTEHLGLLMFFEGSYEVRNFTSLAYTLPSASVPLPPELPRSLLASGFVFNAGLELKFRKKAPKQ